MFGANTLTKGLTFGKVIGGISKGLNFASQVIPLYEQAKPMIQNARKIMSVIKEFKNTPSDKSEKKEKITPNKNINTKIKESKTFPITNQPVFFQ